MKLLHRKPRLLLLMLALSIMLTQCRKDEVSTEVVPQEIGDYSDVSFLIAVSGDGGQLLPSAAIQIENQINTFQADQYGVITIDEITIPKIGVKAKISADGYEDQTIRLLGSPNAVTSLDVNLIELTSQIISTGQSGEISDGCTLELPTTLETSNGNEYTGPVTVESKLINTDDQLLSIAQGNLQAITKGNEYRQLATTSMLHVALYDNAGNQLNIPAGKNAKITIPLTGSNLNIDTDNMKAWSLHNQSATWYESGSVTRQEENFVAEIDRVSWINIAPSYQFHQARISFKDANARAIPHLKIQFFVDDHLFNEVYTNDANDLSINLPILEEITVKYYYDGVEYSESIGIFDGTQMDVNITLQDVAAYQITGTVANCLNQNLSASYGILTRPTSSSVFQIRNGEFAYLNILEEHTVSFVDQSNHESTNIAIDPEEEDIILGAINICNEDLATVSGYIQLDLDEDGTADTPLANQSVRLSSDDISLQQNTDANGYYNFTYIQEDSVYLQFEVDQDQHVIFQSGDQSPESADQLIGYALGYAIKNLTPIDDQDNNFVLINQGSGNISGTYFADTDGNGIGDQALEWQEINSLTEERIGFVAADGTFTLARPNGHGQLATGFYDYLQDYDTTPDPDGDDSIEGPNGRIPYFINSNEEDKDNNFVINLDFTAIVFQVLEDTDGDGIGDFPVTEGQINIEHLTGGSPTVGTSLELSSSRYPKVELGIGFAEFHEATLTLPFAYELISIEDLTPDNNPIPSGNIMNIRTTGAEWDAGNTFTIKAL